MGRTWFAAQVHGGPAADADASRPLAALYGVSVAFLLCAFTAAWWALARRAPGLRSTAPSDTALTWIIAVDVAHASLNATRCAVLLWAACVGKTCSRVPARALARPPAAR